MKKLFLTLLAIALSACASHYKIIHDYPTKPLVFPADEAAHNWAQTEWWYYTGHLNADDGKEYGFELTFFKRLTNDDKTPYLKLPASWIMDVAMIGHFAVTDISKSTFTYAEKGNLLLKSRADTDRYNISIGPWSALSDNGEHKLKADMKDYSIELSLKPVKAPVPNGPGGIVAKGGGNANYYYSITNMDIDGFITVAKKKVHVKGVAWMDHEFGTMKMAKGATGWDWFSLQMDDNTELMIYMIRKSKNIVPEAGATYVDDKGNYKWLKLGDIEIKALSTWHSDKTDSDYPSGWEIKIKPLDLSLNVKPVLSDQELDLNPLFYWEGAVTADGTKAGDKISGKGYVELVGYSKKMPLMGTEIE